VNSLKYFNIFNRRYTGSKLKLIPWIHEVIADNCKNTSSFTDIFAGTGSVSHSILGLFKEIIINDFLFSNEVIYKGFFEQSSWSEDAVREFIQGFSKVDASALKDNYFSKNYGTKYFSNNDAKLIGHIRDRLEIQKNSFSEKEFNIILSSLVYSVDKAANTVGHYDAYRIRPDIKDRFVFHQILPLKLNNTIKIYREDANEIIRSLETDVLYVDPPYNSRQYSRFYHLLENLVQWKKPQLHGVAMKPDPENMSDYCKVSAFEAFQDLINNADAKTIIVSYNNTYQSKSSSSKNKISHDQILTALRERGPIKEFSKKHTHFNAGKTDFSDHKEYLFITQVKN